MIVGGWPDWRRRAVVTGAYLPALPASFPKSLKFVAKGPGRSGLVSDRNTAWPTTITTAATTADRARQLICVCFLDLLDLGANLVQLRIALTLTLGLGGVKEAVAKAKHLTIPGYADQCIQFSRWNLWLCRVLVGFAHRERPGKYLDEDFGGKERRLAAIAATRGADIELPPSSVIPAPGTAM